MWLCYSGMFIIVLYNISLKNTGEDPLAHIHETPSLIVHFLNTKTRKPKGSTEINLKNQAFLKSRHKSKK